MRISSPAILLVLSACGAVDTQSEQSPAAPALNSAGQSESPAAETALACALQGGDDFRPVCTVDEDQDGDATMLTVRQPDGGFHRLRKTGDTVTAADGAEAARVTRVDDRSVVVAIGDARYRLPLPARY